MAFLNEKGTKKLRDDYVKRIETVSSQVSSLQGTIEGDLEGYVQDTELTEQLVPYAKSADVTSQLADYVSKTALKEEVKSVYGTVASWGGSVDNYEALSTEKQDAEEGTIINCTDTNENYIKTTDGWDKFDVKVDLSSYATTQSVTTTLQSYVTSEALEGKKYIDETELTAKNFVDSETLEGKNYVDSDTLDSKNFVDATTLEGKKYVSEDELTSKVTAIPDDTIDQIIAGTYEEV